MSGNVLFPRMLETVHRSGEIAVVGLSSAYFMMALYEAAFAGLVLCCGIVHHFVRSLEQYGYWCCQLGCLMTWSVVWMILIPPWIYAVMKQGVLVTYAQVFAVFKMIQWCVCWRLGNQTADSLFMRVVQMTSLDSSLPDLSVYLGCKLIHGMTFVAYVFVNSSELAGCLTWIRMSCMYFAGASMMMIRKILRRESTKHRDLWTLSYGFIHTHALGLGCASHQLCGICLDVLCTSAAKISASRLKLRRRAPSMAACRTRHMAAQAGLSVSRGSTVVSGRVATLPCGHSFHSHCWNNAAEYSLQCPFCRRYMGPEPEPPPVQLTDLETSCVAGGWLMMHCWLSPNTARWLCSCRHAGSLRMGSPCVGSPRSSLRTLQRSRADGKDTAEEGNRDEVKVVVRVRPPLDASRPIAHIVDEADPTKLLCTSDGGSSGSTSGPRNVAVEELSFSRVVGPQEDNRRTYETLGLKDLIHGVTRGFQETVFAYGQTGSGKTHTILGSAKGEPGLLQLCTRDLFSLVFGTAVQNDTRHSIQLVCLEIKNEDVIDLLPENADSTPDSAARQQTTQESISIKGRRSSFRKRTVWSYDETMWLLRGAVASREVGSSSINSESSRSHMVIRFIVKTYTGVDSMINGSGNVRTTGVVGSLTLVDLAGNEREGPNDAAHSMRKEEAKAINVSLTHLNRMLVKMQTGQLDESDRRQSALNMILYGSLREDCGVTMVFCIHPDKRYASSAKSTLQMALRCRRIARKKKVRQIEAAGYQDELAGLRVEACALTHAHHQALAARMEKEEELQQTSDMLRDLTDKYEAKNKEYEALRASLGNPYKEDQSKPRRVADLERRNHILEGMINQMKRQKSKKYAADDRCHELERAHQDELRLLRDAYESQLRELQGVLRKRDFVDESDLKLAQNSEGTISGASPPNSSAGEPFSEPSMHSSRTGLADDDAAEVHAMLLSSSLESTNGEGRSSSDNQSLAEQQRSVQRSIGQVASPQHCFPEFSSSSRPQWRGSDVPVAGWEVDRALRQLQAQPLAKTAEDVASAENAVHQLFQFVMKKKKLEREKTLQCIEAAVGSMKQFPRSLAIKRDGARLLAELGKANPDVKDDIVSRHAIPIAVDVLNSLVSCRTEADRKDEYALQESMVLSKSDTPPAAEVCSSFFRLIGVLCQQHEGRQNAIRELGGLGTVIRCLSMSTIHKNHEAVLHGCWLLMILCKKNAGNQELVREHGGAGMLLYLLDAEIGSVRAAESSLDATRVVEQNSAQLCTYITGCLAAVTEGNVENQDALYKAGATRVLVRTLDTCLQSPQVVGNTCVAMAMLARRHEHSQNAARADGGIKPILHALFAYPPGTHSNVNVSICRAIAVLTEDNPGNQKAFVVARVPDGDKESCVLTLLLKALADVPEDEPGITTACWALKNISREYPQAMERVRALSGLKIIVSLLHRFAHKEQACEYMCHLVGELSRGDSTAARSNRQDLRALGVVEAMQAVKEHHGNSDGCAFVRALEALRNLQEIH